MPFAITIMLAAFFLQQGGGESTGTAKPEKMAPLGFESISLPKLSDPLLSEPCFVPRNPQSGLAWFTSHATRRSGSVGTFQVLRYHQGALGLETGTEFALPQGYEKIIAQRRPRTSQVPWIGERKDWTLSIGLLPLAPLFVPPHRLSLLQRFPITLQASDCPFSSDLDRDGEPELWFLPLEIPTAVGSIQPLPEILLAMGTQKTDVEKLDEDWRKELTHSRSVKFWDLDEDQYEEVIVMRDKEPALTFHNSSNLQLDRLSKDSGLLDKSNAPVRQSELCLGPKRRDLQWALAYGSEEREPLLLLRKALESNFHEFGTFTHTLADLHVLDARIFDFDGDAREELVLLARRFRKPAPAKSPTDPESDPRNPALLEGVTPELMMFKLGRKDSDPPRLMDKGLRLPGATGLCIGDLDGDAAPDLVVLRGLDHPRVFRNTAFRPATARFYRLALRGPEDWRQMIGTYIDVYDPDSEEVLARFRWPPLRSEDQPLLWLTYELERNAPLAGLLVNWADGQALDLEDLVRGAYRYEKR